MVPEPQVGNPSANAAHGHGTPGPRLSAPAPNRWCDDRASKGCCEPLTGKPPSGVDHTTRPRPPRSRADFPQPLEGPALQRSACNRPSRAAHQAAGTQQCRPPQPVTKTSAGSTALLNLAGDTVTGTDSFRFDRPAAPQQAASQPSSSPGTPKRCRGHERRRLRFGHA